MKLSYLTFILVLGSTQAMAQFGEVKVNIKIPERIHIEQTQQIVLNANDNMGVYWSDLSTTSKSDLDFSLRTEDGSDMEADIEIYMNGTTYTLVNGNLPLTSLHANEPINNLSFRMKENSSAPARNYFYTLSTD